MNPNIIEAQNLPESEKVYLKKDFIGWRVVEPPTKWYHYILGSRRNAFTLLLILLILGFLMYSYRHDINAIQNQYREIAKDPIAWCEDVNSGKVNMSKYYLTVNLTQFEDKVKGGRV